jgi:hypothetical protein
MTTLTADSSPDLAGASWVKLVALYGVGPILAVILTFWLTHSVSAKQDTQLQEAEATKALIVQHIDTTHGQLDRIARQLEANCRVQAVLAKSKVAETMCEVGR